VQHGPVVLRRPVEVQHLPAFRQRFPVPESKEGPRLCARLVVLGNQRPQAEVIGTWFIPALRVYLRIFVIRSFLFPGCGLTRAAHHCFADGIFFRN
jgi:hypothetical protein